MKIYQLVAATLVDHAVDTVFGLMGDANLLYLTEFIGVHDGRFVPSAFEGSAVSMADGYYRTTGRIAVCSVTHGPAFTNTLTPLVEGVRARSPILLITAAVPAVPGHLQDIDIVGLCDVAGAGYERVYRPSTARRDMVRAFHQAHAERRPIVLDVPYDLLEREVDESRLGSETARTTPLRTPPDSDALDDVLGLAVSARRPVVLAGRGGRPLGARRAR